MTIEQNLNHVYYKDDNIHPEAISLRAPGVFKKKENIVINIPGRFQRITTYENGLIVCEEMIPGKHIFRFNRPFNEIEAGVLYFE
ncbi:hypothetical protein CYK80_03985 [Clostridium perfringens]|uniref:Uncharacterized protein n=1 Tax=Clostridium perfringens TaxID=1502 RepID=A0AB37C8V0_CLOPF|nr:hypothetical protein [Clostridium perfringens]PWX42133.1 hypothetical protein CYK91_03105 [Clostridium perfringens]PZT49918.1 hypothetical protein CYK80_03985 [Clostridium perfringens]HAT4306155.1 hypothetical protein [Clostridium perfringens]